MDDELPHHIKTYETIGRMMVRWSGVETSIDTLLALAGANRKGPFRQKVGRLTEAFMDDAGLAQPSSFGGLAAEALRLAPRRNVIAHWTITRMDGHAVTYVNPELFPFTEREDHTQATLEDLSGEIADLARGLHGYVARYHSALMAMLPLQEE